MLAIPEGFNSIVIGYQVELTCLSSDRHLAPYGSIGQPYVGEYTPAQARVTGLPSWVQTFLGGAAQMH